MKHLRNEHELRNNGMACALPVYPPSPNETVKDRRDVRVQLALKRKNGANISLWHLGTPTRGLADHYSIHAVRGCETTSKNTSILAMATPPSDRNQSKALDT